MNKVLYPDNRLIPTSINTMVVYRVDREKRREEKRREEKRGEPPAFLKFYSTALNGLSSGLKYFHFNLFS
jgi:hypothetical protein